MKILCGTDFSVHANLAAQAAAALAKRAQGTLTLLHVLDPNRYLKPTKDLMEHLRNGRQKKLDLLSERLKRTGVKFEARVVEGSPASKLAECATETEAQLLVISATGQIAPTQWFAGSVTDEVVQCSSIPALILRNATAFKDWADGKRALKLVVGYDFSASAEVALRWVASLREIAPCEIIVVYVASTANERARLGTAPAMSSLYFPSGIKKFLETELKQKCDSVLGEDGATICVKAAWGRPDSQLIETAGENRADLLVVGAGQRRGLARLGSVSRAVLHYAHVNVACVPAPRVAHPASTERPQFNRVLVPIDFTALDEQVIAHAYASVRSGGEVCLVHVVAPQPQNGVAAHRIGKGRDKDQELSARLEALIPPAAANRSITTQGAVVEHHELATAICQAADRFEADLICMGSRGRSRYKEELFGSVSQAVMTQSERAVFVLRGNEPRQSVLAIKNEPINQGN